MTQHMKEPWAIDPDTRSGMEWNNHIVSADHPHIRICFMAHDGTNENTRGEANARRIVACVNACAGIDSEYLKSPDNLATYAKRMAIHRDVLQAALKEISNTALCHPYSGVTCGEIARKALAKAEAS